MVTRALAHGPGNEAHPARSSFIFSTTKVQTLPPLNTSPHRQISNSNLSLTGTRAPNGKIRRVRLEKDTAMLFWAVLPLRRSTARFQPCSRQSNRNERGLEQSTTSYSATSGSSPNTLIYFEFRGPLSQLRRHPAVSVQSERESGSSSRGYLLRRTRRYRAL